MLATVAELWRFPVKSLLGELLAEVDVEERGVVGDRLYAVTENDACLGVFATVEQAGVVRVDDLLPRPRSLTSD